MFRRLSVGEQLVQRRSEIRLWSGTYHEVPDLAALEKGPLSTDENERIRKFGRAVHG